VTAVKFYKDNYVLAGVGGNLNIYKLNDDTEKSLTHVEIFQGQSIHGIVISEKSELIVYGGKLICLIHLSISNDILVATVINTYSLKDWILKIKFIDYYLLAITAHNNASLINATTGDEVKYYTSEEKCILYSAEIVCDQNAELTNNLIFGGTVFSEIIIWKTEYTNKCNQILHRLQGHKGVIFSIAYSKELKKVTSTSDDRSLRIWNIKENNNTLNNGTYWENVTISLHKTAFGHMDRVRASIIIKDLNLIISIGEDSMICTWDLNGNLLNKKNSHQCGPIWSLDVNVEKQLIATGGSDGGLLLHCLVPKVPNLQPLPLNCNDATFLKNNFTPKKIIYTFKFVPKSNCWNLGDHMSEMFSYSLIGSKFNTIAICGLNGNIRIYEETNSEIKLLVKKTLFEERIVFVSIANNGNIILCAEIGIISTYILLNNDLKKMSEFKIPLTNEPWFTAANIIENYLVIGDRKGNIHLYDEDYLPIHTVLKVHCHLGVTDINIYNSTIISTGRDGKCAKFKIHTKKLVKLSCTRIDLKWIGRYFIVNNQEMLCGFLSNKFMICTLNEIIWQVDCGGGHRSWDMNISDNNVNLAFIKNGVIYKTQVILSDILIKPLEESFVSKEINALCSLFSNSSFSIFIIGGEDTILTISIFNRNLNKIGKVLTIQTHLSSIKDIKVIKFHEELQILSFYVISCGGRAQICISKVDIDISNASDPVVHSELLGEHMLNNFDSVKKQTNYEHFQDMRYMNLSVIFSDKSNELTKDGLNILLAAGCSDGFLRIFNVKQNNSKLDINLITSKMTGKCILSVHTIKKTDPDCIIILTTDTEGKIKIWSLFNKGNDVSSQCLSDTYNLQSITNWKSHENGINSCDIKKLGADTYIMATGGDDNALILRLFTIYEEINSFKAENISTWEIKTAHCAQISGVIIFNEFVITTSIDQRISLFEWTANTKEGIQCNYLYQRLTTVADIKGICIINKSINSLLICIYGRGVNILELKTTKENK
ncbi:WD repeat-containing protein 6-like, partial [Ctenocephalides felis]|uniref:WD repeat-containing protein 6-like n=1 Tax=Ctenocephalides felis TaxID=7515 RepID=UPI000E6E4337